jgi:hypothetical protein
LAFIAMPSSPLVISQRLKVMLSENIVFATSVLLAGEPSFAVLLTKMSWSKIF